MSDDEHFDELLTEMVSVGIQLVEVERAFDSMMKRVQDICPRPRCTCMDGRGHPTGGHFADCPCVFSGSPETKKEKTGSRLSSTVGQSGRRLRALVVEWERIQPR